MKNRSNLYHIVDGIVPPIVVPKCRNNYHHVSNLSMGRRYPGELGQRSWFCRGPRDVRCNSEVKAMDRATWEKVKEAIEGLDEKAALINTGDMEAGGRSVVVFVFLDKDDDPIQLEGHLHQGSYMPYIDHEFRDLTNFPHTPFTIYDSWRKDFLLMPTWSRFDVHGDTPIITRPLGFEDEDCKGLDALLGRLFHENKSTQETKGKEREVCSERSGPGLKRKQNLDHGEGGSNLTSKRRRIYKKVIEDGKEVLVIEDSD